MDLKDMILVTENDRGTETNMLMTLDDYKSFIAVDDMSELADNLLQLGRTLGEAEKHLSTEDGDYLLVGCGNSFFTRQHVIHRIHQI